MVTPRLCLIVLLGAACAAPAAATPLGVASSGTWAPTPAPDNDGRPFWDGRSEDGPQAGVGWSAVGSFPEYLSLASGRSAAPFTLTGATSLSLTLVEEIGDFAGVNEFGWVNLDLNAWFPIFTGADTPGASKAVGLGGTVAFYLKSPQGTFLSAGQGYDHFALFRRATGPGSTQYLLGLEDLRDPKVRDYNDLVVAFDQWDPPQAVPEPATLSLVGLGLLAATRRRRA